jgi:hypothetical protein
LLTRDQLEATPLTEEWGRRYELVRRPAQLWEAARTRIADVTTDAQTESRLRKLERDVADIAKRLDELVRLLKRAEDQEVQHAARRAR